MNRTILLALYIFAAANLSAFGQAFIFKEPPPSVPSVYDDNGLFVSPSGNDGTGDGSIAKPFATILHALTLSEPGATIILRGGIYRESEEVRIRQPRITLRSHRNERAVIQAPLDNENTHSMAVYLDVDAHETKLQSLEIMGGYYYGIKMETKWDWGDPNDRAGASQVLIEDCIIHDTGRDCIKIPPNCDDITICRCEIYRSGVGPANLEAENAEGIDNVNGDRMRVSDCFIHDIYSTGVYFKGGAGDCVVERCRIVRCGGGGVMAGFDTSPEFFDLTVNPQRYECMRGMIRNCLIQETAFAGIGFYAAKESYALHNTLINCAREAHSPIYFGVTLQDWEIDENPNDAYGYRPASRLLTIKNNLLLQSNHFSRTMVFIRTFTDEELGRIYALADMPAMDGNLYFSAAGSPLFTDSRPDHLLEDGSLEQWQAHIRSDYGSFSQDPRLDDKGRLLASSPAIDRAVCVDFVKYDIDGRLRDTGCDIGADEWQAATLVSAQEDAAPKTELFSIYPNPANGRAALYFTLVTAQQIRIEAFNILGKSAAVMANEWRPAGSYRIELDGRAWPSGSYWIVLDTIEGRKTVVWTLLR